MELASLAMLNETFNAIFKHCDAVLDFVGKNFIKIHLFFWPPNFGTYGWEQERGVYFSLKKPPDFSHDPFLNTKLGGHFQACQSIFWSYGQISTGGNIVKTGAAAAIYPTTQFGSAESL